MPKKEASLLRGQKEIKEKNIRVSLFFVCFAKVTFSSLLRGQKLKKKNIYKIFYMFARKILSTVISHNLILHSLFSN